MKLMCHLSIHVPRGNWNGDDPNITCPLIWLVGLHGQYPAVLIKAEQTENLFIDTTPCPQGGINISC